MLFEWDDNKEKINIAKHGIDFSTAAHVFQDENRIEFENVLGSFRSVVGTYSKFHSGYKILHLQIYFNRLFKKELLEYEQRKRCKKTRAKSRDYKFTRTFATVIKI